MQSLSSSYKRTKLTLDGLRGYGIELKYLLNKFEHWYLTGKIVLNNKLKLVQFLLIFQINIVKKNNFKTWRKIK